MQGQQQAEARDNGSARCKKLVTPSSALNLRFENSSMLVVAIAKKARVCPCKRRLYQFGKLSSSGNIAVQRFFFGRIPYAHCCAACVSLEGFTSTTRSQMHLLFLLHKNKKKAPKFYFCL